MSSTLAVGGGEGKAAEEEEEEHMMFQISSNNDNDNDTTTTMYDLVLQLFVAQLLGSSLHCNRRSEYNVSSSVIFFKTGDEHDHRLQHKRRKREKGEQTGRNRERQMRSCCTLIME